MEQNKSQSSSVFTSKMGAILAAAGSAVGLGNVWRFPTETGTSGGAAFIIIYIAFMLLLGVPIMVSEFTIGRHGHSDVSHAYSRMSGDKNSLWRHMALIPLIGGTILLSYYAVVAGWTLYYAFSSLSGSMLGKDSMEYVEDFVSFSSNPYRPLIWVYLVLCLTAFIVVKGVQKGIERSSKLMMPLLFLFLILLMVCSLFLPGAAKGFNFLLNPDFSKITSKVILSAMGQAFFSLSVGIGCLCTYACYFRKDVNLINDGLKVASIDTMVALCAGFIIFPAVFSIDGVEPNAGPSLVFITLPSVFHQVLGNIPFLEYGFSVLFYLLLMMAALTSSISMLEMPTAYLHRELRLSRGISVTIVTIVCIVLGTICSLSFGSLKDLTICGLGFFDLCDFLIAKIVMPVGGFLSCVFLGWIVDEKVMKAELTNDGMINSPLYGIIRFLIRYFAPICIILIFVNELGIL